MRSAVSLADLLFRPASIVAALLCHLLELVSALQSVRKGLLEELAQHGAQPLRVILLPREERVAHNLHVRAGLVTNVRKQLV